MKEYVYDSGTQSWNMKYAKPIRSCFFSTANIDSRDIVQFAVETLSAIIVEEIIENEKLDSPL